jgi:hypothetical protein
MMMSDNVHQGTSEENQIRHSGESVACMRRQQVNAEHCRDNGYCQPKLGAEKTSKCVHVDSDRHRDVVMFVLKVPSRD